jgi:hypothetical protein
MQCSPELILVVKAKLSCAQETVHNCLGVTATVVIGILQDPDEFTQDKGEEVKYLPLVDTLLNALRSLLCLDRVILGQIANHYSRIQPLHD